MQDSQYIGVKRAADIIGIKVSLFHYYVRTGQVPDPAFTSGKQRFWQEDVIRAWKPRKRRRRQAGSSK